MCFYSYVFLFRKILYILSEDISADFIVGEHAPAGACGRQKDFLSGAGKRGAGLHAFLKRVTEEDLRKAVGTCTGSDIVAGLSDQDQLFDLAVKRFDPLVVAVIQCGGEPEGNHG